MLLRVVECDLEVGAGLQELRWIHEAERALASLTGFVGDGISPSENGLLGGEVLQFRVLGPWTLLAVQVGVSENQLLVFDGLSVV